MGRNLWNVSEVYISAATKCISKSDIKYLKVACRIEGKMVFMQIFDDTREKNPYKAMEKALDLGTEFMHMKQPEMVMALNDEKSEYVNMLIEKKIPVDLSVRVSGYETDGKEKFGYTIVDWAFSDTKRARKLIAQTLIPTGDVAPIEKIDDLSEFG